MYKILNKKLLAENTFLMDIEAPRIAKSVEPGQFLIVKNTDKGERIPLTVVDYDRDKGFVTIVFQTIGKSTYELSEFEVGDFISDFVGPLGNPSDLIFKSDEELKNENIIFVAGGVGTAPIYPQVKWLKEHGIDADVIIGSRTKDLLILEKEMKEVAGNVYISTDDGTYGFNGRVTDCLKDLVENKGNKYTKAILIGPMIMMKFTSLVTKELNIPTIVSLNPIMVDGTGMCGACRVNVGGTIKFACVDGPEFDGHLVNYDEAMRRQTMYQTEEGRKLLKFEEGESHKHKGCDCGGAK